MNQVADLTLEAIIARLHAVAPAIKAEGVTQLSIFGSRARGDSRPDSDLDILIETNEREALPEFDYFETIRIIREATGLDAQLSIRNQLKPRMAERIADDIIEIF